MPRPVLAFLLFLTLTADAAPRRRAVAAPSGPPPLTFSFDFASGSAHGWEADFADYNPVTDMRTTAEIRLSPPEVGGRPAWYVSGWNYSDDLFMFLRRRVDAAPNQNYLADFTVTLATNAGRDCTGIGGAPGESVYMKAGLSPVKPVPVLMDDHLRLNIDKANQSQSGTHASVAGTLSAEVPTPCGVDAPFSTVVRRHAHRYAVPASAAGELWLLFGTDSGFEGFTQWYVQRIDVTLTPVGAHDPRAAWQKPEAAMQALVAELHGAGVAVDELGRSAFDEIRAREIVFAIGEPGALQELRFYLFDTDHDAAQAQATVPSDGSSIGGIEGHWIAPPHLFRGPQMIVNFIGPDATVLRMLTDRLGPQFAGAAP